MEGATRSIANRNKRSKPIGGGDGDYPAERPHPLHHCGVPSQPGQVKLLPNTGLSVNTPQNIPVMGMVGTVVWMAVSIFARSLKKQSLSRSTFLLLGCRCLRPPLSFPHGSNDIANTIGPFVAVIDVLKNGATITVSVLRVLF